MQMGQNNKTCIKCKDDFVFTPEDIKWIEHGTYSEKIVTCPYCGCINVVKYVDASGLHVNDDKRYY